MSYIGNTPTTAAFLTDTFSGNGSTVAFTMTVAPANTSSIIVAVTGVLQDPSTYSVSGTTLTFSAAPPSGTSNISVRYLGIPASGVATTAYRTVTNPTATAGQTSFTIPSYTVGYVDVYRNGVRLTNGGADFTATTGTTVVLTNAATAGDTITTESFYVSSVLNAIPATAGAVTDSYITDVSASKLTGSRTIPKGTMPTGSVLQVVSTTKTDAFSTTATDYADVTGLSVSITPSSASSKILVLVTFNFSGQNGVAGAVYRFVRNSTAICIGDAAGNRGRSSGGIAYIADINVYTTISGSFLDSPATTSATTYKIQVTGGVAGSYAGVNRTQSDSNVTDPFSSRSASTITVMEIAA